MGIVTLGLVPQAKADPAKDVVKQARKVTKAFQKRGVDGMLLPLRKELNQGIKDLEGLDQMYREMNLYKSLLSEQKGMVIKEVLERGRKVAGENDLYILRNYATEIAAHVRFLSAELIENWRTLGLKVRGVTQATSASALVMMYQSRGQTKSPGGEEATGMNLLGNAEPATPAAAGKSY
jgi:hypothetical protein